MDDTPGNIDIKNNAPVKKESKEEESFDNVEDIGHVQGSSDSSKVIVMRNSNECRGKPLAFYSHPPDDKEGDIATNRKLEEVNDDNSSDGNSNEEGDNNKCNGQHGGDESENEGANNNKNEDNTGQDDNNSTCGIHKKYKKKDNDEDN